MATNNKFPFEKELIEFYLQGNSIASCGREYGLSTYRVKNILLKNDIKTRTRREQNIIENKKRRKYVNDNYFDIIHENQAYLLGFLAADGTISKDDNGIKIGLSSVDHNFLEKVKKEMSIEREVKKEETNNGFFVSTLAFSSEKIKKRLAEFGIVPNKTYKKTINFDKIPEKYKIYFIKGYFDGDGSFDSKNGRVRICAHLDYILKDFQEYLLTKNIKGNIYTFNREKNSIIYSLEYSTLPGLKIMELFYQNQNLQLDRKYQKYKTLLNKRNQETNASK